MSFADHSMDITSKLQGMVEQHRAEIMAATSRSTDGTGAR